MTASDAIVTVDVGDPAGSRELSYADAQRLVRGFLREDRHAMAASVAMQLADALPDNLWPHLVAAQSLFFRQQTELGLEYVDRALAIDGRSVEALVIKGRLCLGAGDRDRAMELIDAAIALKADDSFLFGVKAEFCVDAGDIDAARDSLLKSVALDSRNTGSLLGLAHLPGDNVSDELIKRAEFLIHSGQLPAANRLKAHFALAQAYDRKDDIARHFTHLEVGNDLKNQALGYDANESAREAHGIIDTFSASYFARHEGLRGNAAKIVFIVGFPRCGSTLVEQILSSHPAVAAAGEVYAMRYAVGEFGRSRGARFPQGIGGQPGDALEAIATDYLRRIRRFDRRDVVTDKALANYRFIGLIHVLFPNATVIDVQRNPIDTCYSCYKNLFDVDSLPFAYSLENLASHYRNYRRIIRHWNEVLPGRIHTVSYEQLVGRQEEVTRELLSKCGLPWDDACLNFHENARTVLTSSNIQVRQPLYADSIDRWRVRRQYLGPLLELTSDESPGAAAT